MKTIVLLRHAKSSWKFPELTDHDRPLNKRGRRDAPKMAKYLAENHPAPDLIITSTAVRAKTLAEILHQAYPKAVVDFRETEELYHADTSGILRIVQNLDEQYGNVVLVGHNPAFTWMVDLLTNDYLDNLPTTGAYAITFDDATTWKELQAGKGRRLYFEYPKKHFYGLEN